LTAEAAGSTGRGGSVLLSTSTWDGTAPIDNSMVSGSLIDLQGGLIKTTGLDGKHGSVLLRVPRTADNLNAAIIQSVGTQFVGAKPTLEAFSVYFRSEVTAADFPSDLSNSSSVIYSDAKNFADNLPSALSVFNVRPGVEIRSAAGDMSLSVNELDFDASLRGLDLSTWRFNGQPINLTLRAAGDLTIRGSISDGFVNPNTKPTYNPYLPNGDDGVDRRGMAMPNWALGTGPSADINLVAGADFNSANPMATLALSSFVSSNKGNFTLGFADRRAYTEEELLIADPLTPPITINDMPVALVRTGTGNINLAAARDVTLELLRLETLLDQDQKILVYANQTKPFSDSRSLKHSVMLVGASIYTAGEIDSEAYDAGIRANIPLNVLNPHYLGSAFNNQTSPAMFAKNGGAISIRAGRHIQGPVRKGGLGSYQNGDYDLPIEFDVGTFYLYDYLPESLDDFDLATSKQLAKALKSANADADKIIEGLKSDTGYQVGSIKTRWDYDAYIPVVVTEDGDTYANDYVSVSDMIYELDLKTTFDQKLDLLKSGKLTQDAAKKTLGELTVIIQTGVDQAKIEAARIAAELLAENPETYSKTGKGELIDSAVIVTAFLNDEHFTTRDWAPTGVSPLVNNWLFRQGRSNTNASGQSEFVQLPCKALNCTKPSLTTAWYARPDYFNQSMATLGGGDLNIKAGGAVRDIYASTASNAYMTRGSQGWILNEQGGGDLKMSAGGDIAGAAIYVQKGTATVSTQSSIGAGDNLVLRGDSQKIATYDVNKPVDARVPMGTIFAMGDAQLEVTARKNLTLAAVYNPTLTEQSKYNRSGSITPADYIKDLPNFNENSLLTGLYPVLKYPFYPKYQDANYWNPANDPAIAGTNVFTDFDQFQQNFSQYANFSTYTPASSLKLLAMTGATALVNDAELLAFSGGEMLTNELVTGFANLGLDRPYTAAPSKVKAVAMSGGLRTQNGFAMMPSPNPRLSLWAQGDITLNNGSAGSIHAIDVKAESLSSVSAPRVPTDLDISLIRDSYVKGATAHAEAYAEAANPDAIGTSSIVSLRDVVGDSQFAQYSLNLVRPASIIAGRDIVSLGFVIQNLKSDDLSMVKAGRDLRDETRAAIDCTETNNASICVQHVVTGPGTLLVTAGRDIDLGNQAGIVTRGNLDNPYLPEGGASIQLTTAGLMPDYRTLKTYTPSLNQFDNLQDYVTAALKSLGITQISRSENTVSYPTAELKDLESSTLNDKDRVALYFKMLDKASFLLKSGKLSPEKQKELLTQVLSNSQKLKYDDINNLNLVLLNTASNLSSESLLQVYVSAMLDDLNSSVRAPSNIDLQSRKFEVENELEKMEALKFLDKDSYFKMLDSASYLLEPGKLAPDEQTKILIKILNNSKKLKPDDSYKVKLVLLDTASKLDSETLLKVYVSASLEKLGISQGQPANIDLRTHQSNVSKYLKDLEDPKLDDKNRIALFFKMLDSASFMLGSGKEISPEDQNNLLIRILSNSRKLKYDDSYKLTHVLLNSASKLNPESLLQVYVSATRDDSSIAQSEPSKVDLETRKFNVSKYLKDLEDPKEFEVAPGLTESEKIAQIRLMDEKRVALYFNLLDNASYLLGSGTTISPKDQNNLLIKLLSNSRKLKYEDVKNLTFEDNKKLTFEDGNKLTFALLNTAKNLDLESLAVSERNKRFIEILNNASLLRKADNKLDLSNFDGLIASLFPGLNGDTPVGNLSSHSSQVKTEQGGSIDIFAPTGSVYAGLTMGKPGSKPSNQGLFTVRGGDINALVKNDFLVNQGRVFTLGGGDITLVSQFGNLEAGKGAKTASSAPPPLIVIGKDGSIIVDVSGAVAGSGIATLSTKPGQAISDVNAIAPRGYVDAGDAGIRSTGVTTANAPVLRNQDNFPLGFKSSQDSTNGAAAPAAPPPPPPPPAASNAGDDAKKTLASTNTSIALANLSVELLGFGDVSAGTAGQSSGSSTSGSGKDKNEKDKDEKSQEP